MLETVAEQIQGLRGLAQPAPLRLIAVVQHGDQRTELPLLWQLCSALESCGYPVAMLDATSMESETRPGLRQMLNGMFRPLGEPRDGSWWPAFPAAGGLRLLRQHANGAQQSLEPLGRLFKDYSTLVVYGPCSTVAGLLPGANAAPLVTVSADRTSVLTAYQALKQLLQAGVTPTLVSLARPADPRSEHVAKSLGSTMQHCAKTYLGEQMPVLTIRTDPGADGFSDDIRRLALHLLENATAICQDAVAPPPWSRIGTDEQRVARSH